MKQNKNFPNVVMFYKTYMCVLIIGLFVYRICDELKLNWICIYTIYILVHKFLYFVSNLNVREFMQ